MTIFSLKCIELQSDTSSLLCGVVVIIVLRAIHSGLTGPIVCARASKRIHVMIITIINVNKDEPILGRTFVCAIKANRATSHGVCMYAVNSHCRAFIKIDSHTQQKPVVAIKVAIELRRLILALMH